MHTEEKEFKCKLLWLHLRFIIGYFHAYIYIHIAQAQFQYFCLRVSFVSLHNGTQ